MSEATNGKGFDPFESWREMRDTTMAAWAKVMTETVHTDAYAQSTGAMLDAYLTASAPYYNALQKAITQALQQLNLPSRDEFTQLSERLTNIELKLDDLDSKLDRMLARKTESGRKGPAVPRKEAE